MTYVDSLRVWFYTYSSLKNSEDGLQTKSLYSVPLDQRIGVVVELLLGMHTKQVQDSG